MRKIAALAMLCSAILKRQDYGDISARAQQQEKKVICHEQ